MTDSPGLDLIDYYDRHFRAGMVDLSVSSPAPTPIALDSAALGEVESLAYTSPQGSLALRTAIAARYETLAAGDVLVTSGASEGLAAIAHALLDAHSVAVAERGVYAGLLAAAGRAGARVVVRWTQSAEVAIACNPSVPGGQIIDVESFIASALAAGAVPVVDEVYRELALDGRRIAAAADIDPGAVSVGDLSKPLGLGGLRIGWVATRDASLRARIERELRLLSGGPSTLSVAVAEVALREFDERLAGVVAHVRGNQPEVEAVLARHGWTWTPATAGLTVLARPPFHVDEPALGALREEGLFLLPGETLGYPGAFRVSLLAESGALSRALGCIRALTRDPDAGELVILTKAPFSGEAKTRLAAALGFDAAAALAAAFLEDTLAVASSGSWTTAVEYTPADALPYFEAVAGDASLRVQADGDLGDRILFALRRSLALHARAVLIGSDSPDLPSGLISEAFAELAGHDLVFGPAGDGGFYLAGARRPTDGLFDGVEWSTGTVFARTMSNARHLGYSVAVLPEWHDVDDLGSLASLAERLTGSERCPATRAALSRLSSEVHP